MHKPISSQRQISLTEKVSINDLEANSSAAADTSTQCGMLGDSRICRGELERFFLLSIDLLCITGFDGYFKCLNPAWSKTLGYTDTELLAQPYLEFVHPEDRSATIAEAEKLETGCQNNLEFQNRYRCRDGSYRWLSWNATVVSEQQLIYCIARDITESKQKEEELRQSQQQLADFIENAAIGIHGVGADGTILWANQCELNLLGYTHEEYIGHHIAEFHDDQDAIADMLQKLNNKETLNNYEAKLRCKDDSMRQVLINSNVLWQEDKFIHTCCFTSDITKRKQLERQLKQSVEHLSNLKFALDRSAIVVITDRKGIITEVNDQFCQFSKYSRPELIGKDHRIINSGHHPPSFFKDLWSTIARGKVWKGEIKNRAKDGTYYWVDTTIVPFLDDRAQPWQYLAICFDITARKQTEEQLRQKEERWQLALQGNNDGIWDWNVQTNEVFFSTRWKEMLGYEEHEISNHLDEWSKRVHPDDLETTIQAVQDHLAQKTEYYINEHRVQCKDGSYTWILDRGKALWDEAGNPVRMVGSHTDISDRKRAEAAELELKKALENAVEGIACLDRQGRYLHVNKAYARIHGYQSEEMIGMEFQETIDPEYLEQMVSAYQQMLKSAKVETEIRSLRQDGSIFYKQVVMIGIYDRENTFVGHYCFIKDITRRKQREERLRLLESVVVNANDAVLIAEAEPIDEPGPRIVFVNEAFQHMTGYTLEEVRYKTPRILQGDKTQRSELDKIRYALENWQSVRVELINYRKDGSEFWVEINISPVANETGWYTHWVSVQRDITERKLAEEQLKTQMLRSQLFADISLKIRQSLQLEEILQTTVSELQKLLDADRVLILRLEPPNTLYVVEEAVKPGWDSVIEQGFFNACLDEEYSIKYPQGQLDTIPDIDKVEKNECLIDLLRQFQIKSKLEIPLLLHERLWGMIVIHQCSHTRNWSTWEIDLLKQIANQIAIALGQSHLVEALANFGTNLKHLHRINTTNYQNFDDLFTDCLATGCSIFGMSTGIISQIKGQSYKIQDVQSELEFLETELELNVQDTYCAAVINEKRTITYTRVSDIKSMQTHPVYQNLKLESYIGTPIFVNGEVYGTLNFSSLEARVNNFSIQELELIELMAESIGKFIAAYQSEIQRKQAELALQNSEQRWATLTETVPVGIFLTDASGNCLYVNKFWSEIAGMTVQEASGQGWVNALHPEDRDRIFAEWDRATRKNLPFSSEYRFIRPDGKITWVYGQAIAETAADGSVTGYIGTLTDITERLKIEEMKQALEREKKMSELKLRFFSMASHEFRTPLSIITFATQMLENSEPEWLDAKKIRNIYRIKDSAQKITQLLTDVLTLARAEAEKLELKPKKLNLEQFCQQILEEIKTERPENCLISFVYKGNHNDEVYLDEKLLHSILINLLSNAVKYSPQGEEVNFEVKFQAESVIFTIQDRGIGIPVQDQVHLFEAFHRGENVGRIDGTGLGLAIVKRCVDLQGGEITWNSYPEKGTTFVVSIPIAFKELRALT